MARTQRRMGSALEQAVVRCINPGIPCKGLERWASTCECGKEEEKLSVRICGAQT
jgi:hypothetical protein